MMRQEAKDQQRRERDVTMKEVSELKVELEERARLEMQWKEKMEQEAIRMATETAQLELKLNAEAKGMAVQLKAEASKLTEQLQAESALREKTIAAETAARTQELEAEREFRAEETAQLREHTLSVENIARDDRNFAAAQSMLALQAIGATAGKLNNMVARMHFNIPEPLMLDTTTPPSAVRDGPGHLESPLVPPSSRARLCTANTTTEPRAFPPPLQPLTGACGGTRRDLQGAHRWGEGSRPSAALLDNGTGRVGDVSKEGGSASGGSVWRSGVLSSGKAHQEFAREPSGGAQVLGLGRGPGCTSSLRLRGGGKSSGGGGGISGDADALGAALEASIEGGGESACEASEGVQPGAAGQGGKTVEGQGGGCDEREEEAAVPVAKKVARVINA